MGRTEQEWVQYLLDNATKQDNGCWICHLRPNTRGYLCLRPGGRKGAKWRAHRFIYHHVKSPVPKQLQVHHSCGNKRCINPGHLLLVELKIIPTSAKVVRHSSVAS